MACRGSGVQIPSAPLKMNFRYFKSIIFEVKELATSQILIVILLFIQIGVVTRGLGTSEYGKVALILTLVAIVFRTLHGKNSDVTLISLKKSGTDIFTLSIFYDLLIGLVAFAFCLALFNSTANNLFGAYEVNMILYLLLFTRVIHTFSESSKAVLIYTENLKKFALVETVAHVIRFSTIILLFISNKTIESYLIGQSAYSLIYGFYSLYICREFINIASISISNIKNYFSEFKLTYLKQRVDQIVGIIPQHFDLVILGYFTDYSVVGIFRVSKRLVEPVNYLITILTPYIQSKLSKNELKINFRDLFLKFLFPLGIFIILFYIYFGKSFIEIIAGDQFTNAYNSMLILLIGYIFYFYTFWIRQLLLFNNLIHYHALGRLIALVIFIVFGYILTNFYGPSGLAFAVSFSMIIQKLYEIYVYRRYSNLT